VPAAATVFPSGAVQLKMLNNRTELCLLSTVVKLGSSY